MGRVIDHSGTAEGVGVPMPDSKLVMFGNPSKGAAVMLAYRVSVVEIEREVTHAVRNYDDTRIRDFMPILAERDVRSKLTRAARGR